MEHLNLGNKTHREVLVPGRRAVQAAIRRALDLVPGLVALQEEKGEEVTVAVVVVVAPGLKEDSEEETSNRDRGILVVMGVVERGPGVVEDGCKGEVVQEGRALEGPGRGLVEEGVAEVSSALDLGLGDEATAEVKSVLAQARGTKVDMVEETEEAGQNRGLV